MHSAKRQDHINADLYTQIPSELAEKPQWLCYKNEVRKDKETKVPYNARTGGLGKSNDPSTWSDFDSAVASSENYNGIGFAFTEGDGLVGIDVDHPFDSPCAVEIREHFADSYCEKSPSGNLRIFVKGKAIRCGKGTVDKKIEVYDHTSPRYLTVTGQHIEGTSAQVTEQPEALEWLHRQHFASNDKYEPPAFTRVTNPVSDDMIINQASKASKGGKFDLLMQGKWQDFESEGRREYESRSEADLSLCNLIASHTSDPEQIDRIFRSSGLYREKWDKSHYSTGETYGQHTISKALSYVVQQQLDHTVPVEDFKLLTANDLMALPSLRWFIKGVLPDKGLAAIYGPPGSGKSFLVIDMAIAIASGTPWFEHRVQAAKVLYVALEGEGGVANRVKAYQIENRALPDSIRFLIQSFDLRNTRCSSFLCLIFENTDRSWVVADSRRHEEPDFLAKIR